MAPVISVPAVGRACAEREVSIIFSLDFAVSRSTLGAKARRSARSCVERCPRTSTPGQLISDAVHVDVGAAPEAAAEERDKSQCAAGPCPDDALKSTDGSAGDFGEISAGHRRACDIGFSEAHDCVAQQGALSRGWHRGLRAAGCLLHRVPRFRWNQRKCQEAWNCQFKDISPSSPPSDSCTCARRRSSFNKVCQQPAQSNSGNEASTPSVLTAAACSKLPRATSPAASSSTGVPSPAASSPGTSSPAATSPATSAPATPLLTPSVSTAAFSSHAENSAAPKQMKPRTPPPSWPPPQAPPGGRRSRSEPGVKRSACSAPAAAAPASLTAEQLLRAATAVAASRPRFSAPEPSGAGNSRRRDAGCAASSPQSCASPSPERVAGARSAAVPLWESCPSPSREKRAGDSCAGAARPASVSEPAGAERRQTGAAQSVRSPEPATSTRSTGARGSYFMGSAQPVSSPRQTSAPPGQASTTGSAPRSPASKTRSPLHSRTSTPLRSFQQPRQAAPAQGSPLSSPSAARASLGATARGPGSPLSSPSAARASLGATARATSGEDVGTSTSAVTTGLDVSMLTTLGPAEAERSLLAALRRVSAVTEPSLRRRLLKDVQRRVHPDKWPTEQQDLATRLFQVLQEHREATLAGRLGLPKGNQARKA